MKYARLRQPAMSALAVLLISGAGIAFAANSPSATVKAAPVTIPAVAPAVAAPAAPVEATGADTDTLQQGDQTTPDAPAAAVVPAAKAAPAAAAPAEAAGEAPGTETEQTGAEEPGDASLPGGGHADNPNDPNADHQFDGVE